MSFAYIMNYYLKTQLCIRISKPNIKNKYEYAGIL